MNNNDDSLLNKTTDEEVLKMTAEMDDEDWIETTTSEKTELNTLEACLLELVMKNDKYDFSKIETAYRFARDAHEGQYRTNGQLYVTHCLSVAIILIRELSMDTDSVCASLLHDTIEDTFVTFNDIRRNFGYDVAMLVDGVTKITKLPMLNKDEVKNESVRKLMLAISKDIRVLCIKLADRLHNIRTLKYCSEDKRRRIATETIYIYAKLADKLGMRSIKEELEDLSFQYLDEYAYREIEHLMELKKDDRDAFINAIKTRIASRINLNDFLREPFIDGRVKSIYGIYIKAYKQDKSVNEIYDRYAVRVIVSTAAECYTILGIVHDMFRPLENRFKDYIGFPKSNGYKSIHTTVLGEEGIPFEIQIRTWEMHKVAEFGIAAHWKYKQGVMGKDDMDERLVWIRQALEFQQANESSDELLNYIKSTANEEDDIVVATPKGDTKTLPAGSTIIDFAYRIHTEVGHKAIGAKVDHRIQKLDYALQTGEVVEIIIGKVPRPNRNWLDFVKTNEAKSKIRTWFKQESRPENIIIGKTQLRKEFAVYNMDVPLEGLEEFLASDIRRSHCNSLDDFYAAIGYGGVVLENLMPRLHEQYKKQYSGEEEYYSEKLLQNKKETPLSGISMPNNGETITGIETRFAKCCNPLPGDVIVGFVTRNGYITVHRDNCENYINSAQTAENIERWHSLDWNKTKQAAHETKIEIIALDRVGLNLDITIILAENKINIIQSSSRNLKDGQAIFEAFIRVENLAQLDRLIARLKTVKDVISVSRH